jgi:uncharacterized damage-inducible protein DinB
MLESWLDFHRDTLLWKCVGLSEAQLRERSCPPSNLSLLGLIRHMTEVEEGWFGHVAGEEPVGRYERPDRPEADFEEVDDADAADNVAAFRAQCVRSRERVAGRSLDDTFVSPRGHTISLRWVYLHMIEEYARHNGHADLIRERIDGVTGD